MAALFVLCGILAGLASYRFGEARATWRRTRDSKTQMRSQRTSAWRRTGSAMLYIGGAILLLFIALNAFK
jgi:hypothetical protein